VEVESSDAASRRFFEASFALQIAEAPAGRGIATDTGAEPRIHPRTDDADVRIAIEPDRAEGIQTDAGGIARTATHGAARARHLFRTKDAVVTRRGAAQVFDTPGRATVVYDFGAECGTVFGPDRDLALEKGYLLVTSRVGELLDRRGLHRVHAMGVARGDDALLCALAMGGGKTTLALELLRRSAGDGSARWRLLSDDCPLIARDGRALPLPIRPGVVAGTALPDVPSDLLVAFPRSRHGAKTLIDARHFAGRIAPPSRVRVIAYGARSDRARPEARRRSWFAGLAVLWSAGVLGRGLPELLEYSAPCSIAGAIELVGARASRVRAMLAALRGAAVYELALCEDAAANASLVEGLLDAHRASARDVATAPMAPQAPPLPAGDDLDGRRGAPTPQTIPQPVVNPADSECLRTDERTSAPSVS
jgi:hypothetical protein